MQQDSPSVALDSWHGRLQGYIDALRQLRSSDSESTATPTEPVPYPATDRTHIPLDGLSKLFKPNRPYMLGLATSLDSPPTPDALLRFAQRCQSKFQRRTLLIDFRPPASHASRDSMPSAAHAVETIDGTDRMVMYLDMQNRGDASLKKGWMSLVGTLPQYKSRYDLVILGLGNVGDWPTSTLGKLCDGVALWMGNDTEVRRMGKMVRQLQRDRISLVGCWTFSYASPQAA